jgi:hypothetical protein
MPFAQCFGRPEAHLSGDLLLGDSVSREGLHHPALLLAGLQPGTRHLGLLPNLRALTGQLSKAATIVIQHGGLARQLLSALHYDVYVFRVHFQSAAPALGQLRSRQRCSTSQKGIKDPLAALGVIPNRPLHQLDGLLRGVIEFILLFIRAAQRVVPGLGSYLQAEVGEAQSAAQRIPAIRNWQVRFNLPYQWAFEMAWSTLGMWQRYPETARDLQWFVGALSPNVAMVEYRCSDFRSNASGMRGWTSERSRRESAHHPIFREACAPNFQADLRRSIDHDGTVILGECATWAGPPARLKGARPGVLEYAKCVTCTGRVAGHT